MSLESVPWWPVVTVVIPCYNEELFISKCLDSVVANGYPAGKLDIVVVDGRSSDRTREIALAYSVRFGNIRVMDNPRKSLAAGWNIGINSARGDVIMTLNAHTTIAPRYIEICVDCLNKYGADYVGGRIVTVPSEHTRLGRAIAGAISHPFGVGNSHFRTGCDGPLWGVAAAFGGYRREVFEQHGAFDETLGRSQDMELALRFRSLGVGCFSCPGWKPATTTAGFRGAAF